MMTRSLLVALAAGGFVAFAGPSTPAVAAPVPVLAPPDGVSLVQEAGYYKRRWRYRDPSEGPCLLPLLPIEGILY